MCPSTYRALLCWAASVPLTWHWKWKTSCQVLQKRQVKREKSEVKLCELTTTKNRGARSHLQLFCATLTFKSSLHVGNLLSDPTSCEVGEHSQFPFLSLPRYAAHSLQDHTGSPEPTASFFLPSLLCCCWLLSLLGLKSCQQKLCSGCTGNLPNVLRTDTVPAVASGLT